MDRQNGQSSAEGQEITQFRKAQNGGMTRLILETDGQNPIAGADAQPRFDPEWFDRWPIRLAWLLSLFARKTPQP